MRIETQMEEPHGETFHHHPFPTDAVKCDAARSGDHVDRGASLLTVYPGDCGSYLLGGFPSILGKFDHDRLRSIQA